SILINSETCQQWISQKIFSTETELLASRVRLEEVEFANGIRDLNNPALLQHFIQVEDDQVAKEQNRSKLNLQFDLAPIVPDATLRPLDKATLQMKERDAEVAKARLEELKFCLARLRSSDPARALASQQDALKTKERSAAEWLDRYRRLQPLINHYL